jgi:hypothetical protein
MLLVVGKVTAYLVEQHSIIENFIYLYFIVYFVLSGAHSRTWRTGRHSVSSNGKEMRLFCALLGVARTHLGTGAWRGRFSTEAQRSWTVRRKRRKEVRLGLMLVKEVISLSDRP